MAKRDEYPASKSIRARLDCLIASHGYMESVLGTMTMLSDEGMFKLPDGVRKQIKEALDRANVAGEAVSGMSEAEH